MGFSQAATVETGSLRALVWARDYLARGALPALGCVLVGLGAAGAAAQVSDATRLVVVVILAQGAIYAVAVALVWRGARVSLASVLAVAALLRLCLLFLPPYLSNDVYRYVWDGRVQGAGVNPYLYIPNDPALAFLRDADIWPNINRADYAPTIYPPVAQMLFFLITRVSASVVAMKLAWLAFEGVTAFAILRLCDLARLPRERLLIYLWCPLGAWEIAGSGHLDAAMIALVALGVLAAARGRDGMVGGLLGAATLVKFFPLVLLPALWRRGSWRAPVVLAVTIVASYALYAGAGAKVLGFLASYSHEEGLSSGAGFWYPQTAQRLVGLAVAPAVYVGAVGLALAVLAFVAWSSQGFNNRVRHALWLGVTGMAALSPSHPWYFLWLAPLVCLAPSPPALWLLVASPVLYWPNSSDTPWNRDILYGGFTILCLAGALGLRFNGSREPSCR